MKYNQFAHRVPPNFEDRDEKVAIDQFEKYVLQLKDHEPCILGGDSMVIFKR